jgi:SAM-dependent methyltransferase
MKSKIVNYDGYDYNYSKYWKNRDYENEAEHIVLNNMLRNERGTWFIDIGGSYGRLADTYVDKYKNCVILDYSLKTLQKNYEDITQKYPNIFLIAANAYRMPFKTSSFDAGLMVRVLHHIEKPKQYLKEIARILNSGATYIQEFPNKRHIKARIKAFLKGDKEIRNLEPYQQPCINLEGAKGDGVYFLNFHPRHIHNLLNEQGFILKKKQGCSYLRIPFLKKIMSVKALIFFEKILQKILGKTDISPSILLKTELVKDDEKQSYSDIKDIIACPICKSPLLFKENIAICKKCGRKYFKKKNIWDFRVE